MLEEFDNFLQFFLGFFRPGHIGEGDFDFFLIMQFGAAFAERHDFAAATLRLLHDKEPNTNQQQHRQQRRKQRCPPRRLRRQFGLDIDFLFPQDIDQSRVVGRNQGEFLTILKFAANRVFHDCYPIDLLILDLFQERGVGHLGLGRGLG